MKRYVTVSDLIRNGGEGCSLLRKEPNNEDHIIIETDDYNADHPDDLRSMSITHYNSETHVTEGLVWQDIRDDMDPDYVLFVSVDDLNNARMMLFRYKMCRSCKYFQQYLKTSQYDNCWHCGDNDNLDNYKEGNCPNKSTGYEEDIIKVNYTNEGRTILLLTK